MPQGGFFYRAMYDSLTATGGTVRLCVHGRNAMARGK
jgi:hypothetical protein